MPSPPRCGPRCWAIWSRGCLADLFPVAVERAGALAGPGGVATASTLGYGGMLLGPPAIGFMAEWISLPAALTSVAVLAAPAAPIGFGTRRVA